MTPQQCKLYLIPLLNLNWKMFLILIIYLWYRNRQGNDTGTQYASAIFVADEEQKKIAEKVKNDLQGYINHHKCPYAGKDIVTQIHDVTKFVSGTEFQI